MATAASVANPRGIPGHMVLKLLAAMKDQKHVGNIEAYQPVLAKGGYKHIVAHPGDVLPVTGVNVKVVSSDGAVIQQAFDSRTGGWGSSAGRDHEQ